MKIGITCVGGGVGMSVLKSVIDSDYDIVALDGEVTGTGLYMSDTAYLIPYANKSNFIDEVLRICETENVSILFPGLDAELLPFANHREEFAQIGTTVVVSSPEVIAVSDNKQHTYDVLTKAGVNVPFTQAAQSFIPTKERFPAIIKPREGGCRSQNVYIAKDMSQFENVTQKIGEDIKDYIVMDYIEGDEYTCGTINLDNKCQGIIVMRRILRDGDTYKCFVEKNEVIEATVLKVMEALKPFGACNVQLRLKDGVPYVFEINARCSGTTAARTLSGFNEPLMIADYLLKGKEPLYKIKMQTIFRYWNELVIDNEDVDAFTKDSMRQIKKAN